MSDILTFAKLDECWKIGENPFKERDISKWKEEIEERGEQ